MKKHYDKNNILGGTILAHDMKYLIIGVNEDESVTVKHEGGTIHTNQTMVIPSLNNGSYKMIIEPSPQYEIY